MIVVTPEFSLYTLFLLEEEKIGGIQMYLRTRLPLKKILFWKSKLSDNITTYKIEQGSITNYK